MLAFVKNIAHFFSHYESKFASRGPAKRFWQSLFGPRRELDGLDWVVWHDRFCFVVAKTELFILDEVMRVYLQPNVGDVVFDVGAHYGFYAIHVSRVAEKVYAFEPSSHNFRRLLANININHAENTKAFQFALSNREGIVDLLVDRDSPALCRTATGGKADAPIPCEATTIDKAVKKLHIKQLNLVKIDTEGSELQVLKGALQTFITLQPKLTIAAYHTSNQAQQILQWITTNLKTYRVEAKRFFPNAHQWVINAHST